MLIRAEKTPEGYKGIYVSLNEDNVPSFDVTLDAQGKELHRERLEVDRRFDACQLPRQPPRRLMDAAVAVAPDEGAGGRGGNSVVLPITRPATILKPDDWNQIEIFLDANIVRSHLNDANTTAGASDHAEEGYGPLALYVGGSGEVRFKEIAFKDIGMKYTPAEIVSPNFRMQRISDMSYSWSAAAADFNRDGVMDIVAGPYIYYGPDFTRSREIFLATTYSPSSQLPATNCEFAYDFNGDGWPDILTGTGRPALCISIRKGSLAAGKKYVVLPGVQNRDCIAEGHRWRRQTRSGLRSGLHRALRQVRSRRSDQTLDRSFGLRTGLFDRARPGSRRPQWRWPHGYRESVRMVGTAPGRERTQELWTYHPQAFARSGRVAPGGSVMAVYDVNGDGLNDVVTSRAATDLVSRGSSRNVMQLLGKISFVEHMIADDFSTKNAGGVAFSEQHGSTFADVDRRREFRTSLWGKRYWSHADTYLDPDPNGAPVLYVYHTVRNPKAPGGAEFVPELIHNRSGAGSDLLAVDLNNDGAMDIVTSTGRGTFIFWGKPRAGKAAPSGRK